MASNNMFEKLKDKLKSWFKSSEEKIKGEEKDDKLTEKLTIEKPKEKIKEKLKKKKKTKKEIKEEREVTEKVLEDIHQEGLEIKSVEERVEELEKVKKLEKPVEEGFFRRLFSKKEKPKEKIEEVFKLEKPKEVAEKEGFFQRVVSRFKFKISEEYFDGIFSDLETLLLENNVAFEVVERLKQNLKKELVGKEISKNEVENEIKNALKISIEKLIKEPFDLVEKIKEKEEPFIIIFFGINGSGKTTTLAKLAHLLKEKSFGVVVAAADTFRAASIEQLSEHTNKLGIKIIKSQYNADPTSVAFDAVKYAKSHKIKVVLVDTAGRMHTKDSLMKEMEKICRVIKPDLKIFVAESITGNDAVEQAKIFNNAVGIDGIILTKADVDEKGGTVLSVSHVTNKPILYLGVGQKYQDLKPFKKSEFIDSLGL